MELDSRILEGKTYLDCFDTEVAKGFIGKECYLSDGVASFANVDNLNKAVLIEVDDENIKPYTLENIRWRYSSNFILPCEWVKSEEPEKKYRPYTMSEFKSEFKINTILTLRKRNEDKYVYQTVYLGNRHYDDTDSDENFIYLSHGTYSLKELFEKFEIVCNGDWQPFGVEEQVMKAQWDYEVSKIRASKFNGVEVSSQSVYVPNTYDLRSGR